MDAASERLNISATTLRQQCFRGQIAGVKVKDGNRMVWAIPPYEFERLLKNKDQRDEYDLLYAEWVSNMEKGIGHKRPLSQKGVEGNIYGLEKFWIFLENPPTEIKSGRRKVNGKWVDPQKPTRKPNIKDIHFHNLEISISNVPIDYKNENCHFSMRDQMYKSFRSFFRFLVRKGLRDRLAFAQLEDAKPERLFIEKRPVLTEGQLENLIGQNDNLISGRLKHRVDFDACLSKVAVLLAGLTGMRLGEIINLRRDEVLFNAQEMSFIGKGNKRRTVGIGPDVYQVLKDWDTKFRPASKHPNLLLQDDGEPVSRHIIYRRIKRLGKRIGVPSASPHALRRTAASIALERGIPIHHISENLGHTRISTTEKSYVSRYKKDVVNSFKKLTLKKQFNQEVPERQEAGAKTKAEKAALILQMLEQLENA